VARKPRIQFANAIYHVINRGNYRHDVFATAGALQIFENCLLEACELAGWLLHAYVLMSNHFHLAVETPRANLFQGMHWLESKFSTRFNRFRGESGHVFQGRYKSFLVEPGTPLARVVDYIHLNPARAHIVSAQQLPEFRWSSYRRFLGPDRPAFLICKEWLFQHGLADTSAGWEDYQRHLMQVAGQDPESRTREPFASGWAIGCDDWRKIIVDDQKTRLAELALSGARETELLHLQWKCALSELLAEAGQTEDSARQAPKGAGWKIELAGKLRWSVGATVRWIARELHMGSPNSVRVYLSRHSKEINK